MSVLLNPYISFRDTARAAMEFYRSVFGGELTVNTFGESGMSHGPGDDDKVMHAMLTADNGLVLMGADTPADMDVTPGTNYSVSLSGDDDAALNRYWTALSDGGSIGVPLAKAPWGDSFGMCVDKFGVNWMVNITGTAA